MNTLNHLVAVLKESTMKRAESAVVSNCSVCRHLCDVFMLEGFIHMYQHSVEKRVKNKDFLHIYMKYALYEPHIFEKMKVVSTSASKQYLSKNSIIKNYGTARGLVIMSSTHGMFYYSCDRDLKSGGIVLLEF